MEKYLPFLAAGGIFTAVAMSWGYIRAALSHIYSIFIVEVTLDSRTKGIVYDYIIKNKMASDFFRKKSIYAYWLFYRPSNKNIYLPTETAGDFVIFFNGIFPIVMQKSKTERSSSDSMSLLFLRFSLDLNKFLSDTFKEQIAKRADTQVNRVFVHRFTGSGSGGVLINQKDSINDKITTQGISSGYTLVGFDEEDTKSNTTENMLTNYCFPKEATDALSFLKKWNKSKQWYNKKMIPWKLGLCLEGKPGTGKSSFCRVVSSELNMPIFVFDIATMSNEEFLENWKIAATYTPCICLIEDIDRVFDKDVNKTTGDMIKQHLTFDCLLNCISGVENSEGIISVITANNADRIDESLGVATANGLNSRPGRIDFILHFDVLEKECRLEIAARMLSECPELINEVVDGGEGQTAAQFVNKCSTIALNQYWKNKTATDSTSED